MKHFIRYTCLHGPVNLDFLVFPLCTRRLLLGVVLTLCNNNNVKTELCSTRIYAIIGYEGCSHLCIANIFLVHTLTHSHSHTYITDSHSHTPKLYMIVKYLDDLFERFWGNRHQIIIKLSRFIRSDTRTLTND